MSNCSDLHNLSYEQEHGPLQMFTPAKLMQYVTSTAFCFFKGGPQNLCVQPDCYFIVNVLDLPFA